MDSNFQSIQTAVKETSSLLDISCFLEKTKPSQTLKVAYLIDILKGAYRGECVNVTFDLEDIEYFGLAKLLVDNKFIPDSQDAQVAFLVKKRKVFIDNNIDRSS